MPRSSGRAEIGSVSTADYQRAWRAKHGARTGRPGPKPTRPHGTLAAYRRHQRAGEPPCGPCKEANAAYQRQRYAARKQNPE